VTDAVGPETFRPAGASRRSRSRALSTVVLGLTVTGVFIGGLWAWIAPPIHAVVAITHTGERVHDYLGNESQHFFDAPCLMLGLLTLVAIVTAVLVWQWRAHRGPGMVIGLAIGMVTGAAAAAAVGAALVRLRYGTLNFDAIPLSADHKLAYVIQVPPVFFAQSPLQVMVTIVWPAAIAALVYALIAAGSARDDLGALPAADQPPNALSVEPEASVS
jgi:Protein of unknown function (DUF2567)